MMHGAPLNMDTIALRDCTKEFQTVFDRLLPDSNPPRKAILDENRYRLTWGVLMMDGWPRLVQQFNVNKLRKKFNKTIFGCSARFFKKSLQNVQNRIKIQDFTNTISPKIQIVSSREIFSKKIRFRLTEANADELFANVHLNQFTMLKIKLKIHKKVDKTNKIVSKFLFFKEISSKIHFFHSKSRNSKNLF